MRRHRPPWRGDGPEHGPWGMRHGPPGKWRSSGVTPRFLFFRFLAVFGFMALLFFGGMAAVAYLVTRLVGGSGGTAFLVWIVGISLAFTLPALAIGVAMRAFRGIAAPLADVMAAAEQVGQGDLTVRVQEQRRGEFGRLAEAFNRMAEELERSDQLRRNLTADVAHELRTPLHVIQGNLEGILDGVYDPAPDHINATLNETRLLARLVEDLRTLSLAEAGQLPLEREKVDVVEMIEDVRTSFSGQAEVGGVDLHTIVSRNDTPIALEADPTRLEQVLNNLVANALRHTPPGGTITLEAATVPEGVRIVVRDTGEGIASDDLPYIFDRFWRADRARTRGDRVGAGLGLAIARQLVQAHGGGIDVQSAPGQGTAFTIDLPSG